MTKINNNTYPETMEVEVENLSPENNKLKNKHYQRFAPFLRFTHLLIVVSFISLAVTGMIIKFADVGVFQALAKFLGGYQVTGFIHRVGAIITFLYFGMHITFLIKKRKETSAKYLFLGDNSMMFNKRDLKEFVGTIKWFLGKGPRPDYGRWTYWEKFDYFAVFWGVAVIGFSGLILWFPEFFTLIGFPGWFINVATIIHSDEALLAVGFIFTIHFFNTHFRPDKFPIDTTIFTGSMSIEELKYDRPRQYRTLIETGELNERLVDPPPPWLVKASKIFGFTALTIGITIIIMIIYSMIFLYR
ncbi:MAG: cytochrome b/b6 domain-containing protein [Melioribacteraceae bacterium]|nr:cytochrome b/b6 domain-containing protein [Melioribacteraceae bacterium]